MNSPWNDRQPIYRQLRDQMVARILDGSLREGQALPSIRVVAAQYRLNPLTVLKAYQQLVEQRLVQKRRGRGMYVSDGARPTLLADERQRFRNEEWPRVLEMIRRLGFSAGELLAEPPVATPTPARPPDSGVANRGF